MARKNATETLPANAEGIAKAAEMLRNGQIVALPTETVYGLAARADSDAAVARIYRAKGRPSFNPLIVHVGSLDQARTIARFSEEAENLARRFWPGPLTIVLPTLAGSRLAAAVTARLPTVALRHPAHPVMQALLAATGLPLAAPSANRSGDVSPTDPAHVVRSLGQAAGLVLDAGPCGQGLESTIVALRENGSWQLLRPGPISEAAISQELRCAASAGSSTIEAPGQLTSHYSPGKPVRLNAKTAERDEFFIGFGNIGGDTTLSQDGNLVIAASRLYRTLHEAAASPKPRVAVAPVPAGGIGAAINDRLQRAAAGRD
ncbi:L-threonylcarbamoyladenylate synthase [Altererythrobacter aquiaggeris]|uniref:L-threonylcarbamoyladenylate synthase n=1 Tax=Aestuarierythrobacter aquiaggeris TaxID=1898396 RepID=UPI00301A9873